MNIMTIEERKLNASEKYENLAAKTAYSTPW
jgi:hypothetical protein